jgi:hydroxymethylglutaryl-CoA lyase
MSDRPSKVRVREVGPRDGFQNEPERIPTDEKIRLIEALAASGLKHIEATSFVRKDVIPQLGDGPEVLSRIDVPDDVRLSVLVPNERGLDNALSLAEHFHEVGVFVSASETHNKKNVNRTIAESMEGNAKMLPRILEAGLGCEAVIATSFGCPYEGEVPRDRVLDIAERFAELGAKEVGFGDTTGMANPWQVEEFFGAALERLPGVELTAHFHNTRGQGLANAVAALNVGCTGFESSFGELGGCPVPPGSTGNIATEDLVSMFHEMGVETGVDLPRLLEASRAVQELLGRPLTSHTIVAGPVEWQHA